MKKTETFFISVGLIAIVIITAAVFLYRGITDRPEKNHVYPVTNYGAFLAAQHAMHVNDFDKANYFSSKIDGVTYDTVKDLKYLSQFLTGVLPENAKSLKTEKSIPAELIYDAYLLQNNNWKDLYARHKNDISTLSAPLRIWSSVANNYKTNALKFVDELPTTSSWKALITGQIYAEIGNIDKAKEFFAKVQPDFMNINDYTYLMSFYTHHNLKDEADKLQKEFTSLPGGMFMLNYKNIPDWSMYSGYKNALAFDLMQNVSHTQIMIYSDLSILLLRFAQITGENFGADNDAMNYYLGQFFYNNSGDYNKYFSRIKSDSPFYLFAVLRQAEKTDNIKQLETLTEKNPLFVPAVRKISAYYIKRDNKNAALKVVNRALDDKQITDYGRAFFLKNRAEIYYIFGDYDKAQKDIHSASNILFADADILSLQAKLWAAQNREIENAYDYAMTLIKKNPTNISSWDTLGRVVAVREGPLAALEVLSRVGEVSSSNSALFEQIGDLYLKVNKPDLARNAYNRAIELSNDGLVIVPRIKIKLGKIK